MRDRALEQEARRANVAVVAALEAIQNERWEEAERAFSDVALLALRLRKQLSTHRNHSAPPEKPMPRGRLANTMLSL